MSEVQTDSQGRAKFNELKNNRKKNFSKFRIYIFTIIVYFFIRHVHSWILLRFNGS
jgi:hypothetical protein